MSFPILNSDSLITPALCSLILRIKDELRQLKNVHNDGRHWSVELEGRDKIWRELVEVNSTAGTDHVLAQLMKNGYRVRSTQKKVSNT